MRGSHHSLCDRPTTEFNESVYEGATAIHIADKTAYIESLCFRSFSATTAMTSYVLDKVELTRPASRLKVNYTTEYGTKYNRQLWDSATRSHYFQLSKDRRRRMLDAAKHAPIHWGSQWENISSEDTEVENMGSISSCHHSLQKPRPPENFVNRNSGAICPKPPKQIKPAWCEQPNRSQSSAPDFIILDGRDANSQLGVKRSTNERSPTPASAFDEKRKRLRTPGSGSNCESDSRASLICRPKSAPSSRLSARSDHSRPSSQSSKSRPSTGASRPSTGHGISRPSTGISRPSTGSSIRSSATTKLPSRSVQSSASLKRCKKVSTTKQASAPFALYGGESETARSHELRDRMVKNAAKGMGVGFQKGSNKLRDQCDMTDLPRDIRLWVTEYQGNFKAFNPI